MHAASKLLKWDNDRKVLLVRFTEEDREVDLAPLYKNHYALKKSKVVPEIEDGGIRIGPVLISGPTAYHMGMPI